MPQFYEPPFALAREPVLPTLKLSDDPAGVSLMAVTDNPRTPVAASTDMDVDQDLGPASPAPRQRSTAPAATPKSSVSGPAQTVVHIAYALSTNGAWFMGTQNVHIHQFMLRIAQ